MFRFSKKISLSSEILNPDEIFMDSKNIPDFDRHQFEGRLEKPITKSTFIKLGICFLLLGGVILGRMVYLQIISGDNFASRSKNNYLRAIVIPPARGIIYDRNGKELAWNGYVVDEKENTKLIRSYANIEGLAHVLGYVGTGIGGKITGIDGIEKKQDEVLGGKNGTKLVETDSKNDIKSESLSKPPENGKNITLTIDADLQAALFNIIGGVVRDRGFNGGAGVILDIDSGEVLAMASYPEYNPQILSSGKPEAVIKNYFTDQQKPFFNRAVSGLYAPGSIIKPVIALAALKEKIISPEKQIFSSGSISLPNPFFPEKKNIFYDWKAHGWVDMRRALAVSSNVYFYTIGGGYEDVKGLGIKKIENYAKLFGFGSKTNIDIDKEEAGLVPSQELKARNSADPVWRIGDTFNASIGQGDFQITPLQAAVYAASLANNGRLVQPHLIFDTENKNEPAGGRTIDIPADYFKIVKEGMRMVVLEGTAQGLSGLGVEVAAKTGTAELESEANRFVNSWLIGFIPYKNPKIAFSVLLEKGRATNLVGGVYVGRQLIEWMLIHTPEYLTSNN